MRSQTNAFSMSKAVGDDALYRAQGGRSAQSALANHQQGVIAGAAVAAAANLGVVIIKPIVSGNLLINLTMPYTLSSGTATFILNVITGAFTLNGTANAALTPGVFGTQPLVTAAGTTTAIITTGALAASPGLLNINVLVATGVVNAVTNPNVAIAINYSAGAGTITYGSSNMSVLEVG